MQASVNVSLEKLSRVWPFGRKQHVEVVRSHISSVELDLDAEKGRAVILEQMLADEKMALQVMNAARERLELELEELQQLNISLSQGRAEDAERIAELDEDVFHKKEAIQALTAVQKELEESLCQAVELNELLNKGRAEDAERIAELGEELKEKERVLSKKKVRLENIEKERLSYSDKFELLKAIISAKTPKNEGLDEFRRVLSEEYMPFAANEGSLADEAGALLALQSIESELELVVSFPEVRSKKIVAVAGAFSSGKSSFINGFLAGDVRLSVGVTPVTAIPCYVINAEDGQGEIRIHNKKGGSEYIRSERMEILSHENMSSLGFDLGDVAPFISFKTKMKWDFFKDVCILDLPGYNPGGDGGRDRSISLSAVDGLDSAVWVVNVKNGIITDNDVTFIVESGMNDLRGGLYLLLNCADLVRPEQVDDIAEEIIDVLCDNGIEVAGVSSYSSVDSSISKVYLGCSVIEFLSSVGGKNDLFENMERRIDDVFDRYREAIRCGQVERENARNALGNVKKLVLSFGTDDYDSFKKHFGVMEKMFANKNNEKGAGLSQCEEIRQALKSAVRNAFNEVGVRKIRVDKADCFECEDYSGSFVESFSSRLARLWGISEDINGMVFPVSGDGFREASRRWSR